jgi:hypothetical protein
MRLPLVQISWSPASCAPVAERRTLSKLPGQVRFPNVTLFWTKFPQFRGDSTEFIDEDRG